MKWIVPFFYSIVFMGCTKDSVSTDHELPVVNLLTPADNAVVSGGASVPISASITDNESLTEIHVHISNQSTGALLIDIHRNPGAASYNLNETFMPQAGIQYKIQVIAKDAAANENRATVTISAN